MRFQATPSGGWATPTDVIELVVPFISIHALRVEGDRRLHRTSRQYRDFYPRPPGGGRREHYRAAVHRHDFYPRPPGGGRRRKGCMGAGMGRFLSTPSGWRATFGLNVWCEYKQISIHALRVEGDVFEPLFLHCRACISIHALRVEGDDHAEI